MSDPLTELIETWRTENAALEREISHAASMHSTSMWIRLASTHETRQSCAEQLSAVLRRGESTEKSAMAELLKALYPYIEWFGGAHDGDCPEDDTCDCDVGRINGRLNIAIRAAEKIVDDAESALASLCERTRT